MLTSYDIERLLARYDLGVVREVSRAPHGFVNETAFVRTDEGRFVVRRMHRRFGVASQSYRHRLIGWLIERDVPTPAMIPARDGNTLTVLDGRIYEVQEFIHGADFNPDRCAQAADVGATLADYHRAIIGFETPEGEAQPRYTPYRIQGFIEKLLELDMLGDLHDTLEWYSARASAIRPALAQYYYQGLPHLIIHGDVHNDNFLFEDDRVLALLDFDQATCDARIVDLADALVAFATGRFPEIPEISWGVYRGPLDEKRAIALIRGYHERNPLSSDEVATLLLLVEVLWLQNELGRVVSTPEGAPDYHLSVLEQGRWLSQWLENHRHQFMTSIVG